MCTYNDMCGRTRVERRLDGCKAEDVVPGSWQVAPGSTRAPWETQRRQPLLLCWPQSTVGIRPYRTQALHASDLRLRWTEVTYGRVERCWRSDRRRRASIVTDRQCPRFHGLSEQASLSAAKLSFRVVLISKHEHVSLYTRASTFASTSPSSTDWPTSFASTSTPITFSIRKSFRPYLLLMYVGLVPARTTDSTVTIAYQRFASPYFHISSLRRGLGSLLRDGPASASWSRCSRSRACVLCGCALAHTM
jgi:hypothetical protein